MAETSGFFNSVSGDRAYDNSFLAAWIASIIGNGAYNGELAVTASGSGMQIILPEGRAWINGYHYRNDADMTFTAGAADGVLDRKDAFVLRWDVNARSIAAQLLKGTPASSASAPAITRSAEQYDLKLAEISIPAGTTAVTQSLITDCRADESVCGFVTGVVQQLDTATLYQQFTDSFSVWFQGMKDQLTTDAAGNLQTEIDDIVSGGTKTGKSGYADTSGNVSQPMDIIDGNFQVSSIGATPGTPYSLAGQGYPIWDTWKWSGSDTNCSLTWIKDAMQIKGSNNIVSLDWAQALNTATSAYWLATYLEKGTALLCSYPALTLSFWARASTEDMKLRINLTQKYGTGGSTQDGGIVDEISLTDTWKRYSVKITPFDLSGKTIKDDNFISLTFAIDGLLNPQTSGQIQFTQVQLDIGENALPYRNKSFEQELHSCMRYYEKSYLYGQSTQSGAHYFGVGTSTSASSMVTGTKFTVSKHTVPTVTLYSGNESNKVWDTTGSASVPVSGVSADNNGFSTASTTGGTSGHICEFGWEADARY